MEINERNGFQSLVLDEKVTLAGQLLLTCGTAFLSLGQIFKLLKSNQLPTTPMQMQRPDHIPEERSLYRNGRSYFES